MTFRWRLYLADGSTFDDTQGAPWDAPIRPRVVCIAQPGNGHWDDIVVNDTWFLYRADLGCWTHHETAYDALDELQEHGQAISAVRKGKYVGKPTFLDLWARARKDCGIE